MPHPFTINKEVQIDATPERVWEAIATGPGIDAWFLGSSEVEPGEGGTVRFTLGEFSTEGAITTWEPGKRFTYKGAEAPDGTFMAFDYLIEGRDGGSTVLRLVQSGMLGDADWEAEYDALNRGWGMYMQTLGAYVSHFDGRPNTTLMGQGPQVGSQDEAWTRLLAALGVGEGVSEGDEIRLNLEGLPAVDGVVDIVGTPDFIGVRTDDALYRFSGRIGSFGVGHHIFSDVDQAEASGAWQTWLEKVYA